MYVLKDILISTGDVIGITIEESGGVIYLIHIDMCVSNINTNSNDWS